MSLHPEEVLAIKDGLARPSSRATSFFLPCDSPGVGERGFSQVVTQLHQLTGPISLTCDRYVQILASGGQPIGHKLTQVGATALKVSSFHTPLPDLPNWWSSPFHLRAPPDHQFSQNLTTKTELSFKDPKAVTWSSNHSVIYHGLQLCLIIADDLSLAIGSSRIDRKVSLCN
jgi:hypothetical protein